MANDFLQQVAQSMYADQAAPVPPELAKALADPQTYRQLQEGAATGSVGMFGDMGEVFKQGLGNYAKYLPTFLRAPVQAMQAAPTTEGVTQLLTKAGYPFSDTESMAHEIGTYFSPVGAGLAGLTARAGLKAYNAPHRAMLRALRRQGVEKEQIPTFEQMKFGPEWTGIHADDSLYGEPSTPELDFSSGIGEFMTKYPEYLSPEIQRKLDRSLFAKTGPMGFEDPEDLGQDLFYFIDRWTNDHWNEGPTVNYHKIHQFFDEPVNVDLKKEYYDVIRPELKKLYPSGKIPVKRRVPFAVHHWEYTNAKGEDVSEPIRDNAFLVDIDDVVFTSAFREKEIVVKNKDGEFIATSPLTKEDLQDVKKGDLKYDPDYKLTKAKSHRYPTADNLEEELTDLSVNLKKFKEEVGDGDVTENTVGRLAPYKNILEKGNEKFQVRNFKGNDDARVKRLQYLVNLTEDPRYKGIDFNETLRFVGSQVGDVFDQEKIYFGAFAPQWRQRQFGAMKDKIELPPLKGVDNVYLPEWTYQPSNPRQRKTWGDTEQRQFEARKK